MTTLRARNLSTTFHIQHRLDSSRPKSNLRELATALARLVGILALIGTWGVLVQRLDAPGWLQIPTFALGIFAVTTIQQRLSEIARQPYLDELSPPSIGVAIVLDLVCRAPMFQSSSANLPVQTIARSSFPSSSSIFLGSKPRFLQAWQMGASAAYYLVSLATADKLLTIGCVREAACLLLSSYVVGICAITLIPVQALADRAFDACLPVRVGICIRFTWVNALIFGQIMCYLVAGTWGWMPLILLWVTPCLINAIRSRRGVATRENHKHSTPSRRAA